MVIDIFLMFMLFPGSIFWTMLIPSEEIAVLVIYIIFFTMLGVGILFMILLPIFGGLKQKPVKAEKLAIPFNDYNSLEKHIQSSTVCNGYTQQPGLTFCDDGTLVTYIKPKGLNKENCVALVRVSELKEDNLNLANDAITESLRVYYGKEQITDTVDMITIVCVDRITPTFQKLVNGNIQQGLKNGRLPVGISFGGKSMYIAKQKYGFAISKYKKLRKEFLKIMQIQS